MSTSIQEDKIYQYLEPNYYQKSHRYWMWGHIIQHKAKIMLIVITTIISIVLQTLIPLFFGDAIDNAIPDRNFELLAYFSVLIISFGIIRGILSYFSSIVNEQVAQNVEMQVRVEFFDNLSAKSMDFFNKARVGDLMSQATQDTQNMTFAVSPGIRSIVNAVVGLLAAAIAMASLSTTLSLVFVVILPLYIYFMYRYAKTLQPISMERQERLAKINASLQENITGIRVVRTFSAQEREKKIFSDDIRAYEDILIRRGALSAYFIPTLLLGLVTALIYLIGVYNIEATQSGQDTILLLGLVIPVTPLSVGDLIAFISLTGLLLWPTNILRWLLDATMLGFAGAERIFGTLKTVSQLETGDEINLDEIKGDVEFDNVNFRYEKDSELKALDEFTLSIKNGETVAIIGPTGSGKSTVGRVLNRLYDIDEGVIRIDGQDIANMDISQLRQVVGVIEQDTFLFSTTIGNNIAYGAQDITDDDIIKAAKTAQAHDFIMEFKNGYETIIGERGVTLSGGQKQRVSMARTFITNPKILILDDSTSAVDASTEAKIQKAMDALLENRTTIIITHRLSTLKKADKIVFMRRGRIERMGTHDELISSYKDYRQIFAGFIKLPPIRRNT